MEKWRLREENILFHVCTNCKAKIYYTESRLNSEIGYIQSNNIIRKDGTLTVNFNLYDKVKKYFIECSQCKKNTVCGIEVLEEGIDINKIKEHSRNKEIKPLPELTEKHK